MIESWPAPAKLNLFLHVTGRRPDGYHSLQSVFQFLEIHDRLQFHVTGNGRISRDRPLADVSTEHDLTVRAARLLQESSATGQGVEIRLDKHLPLGGGLGGGSSDAATTLLALNYLWGLGYSLDRLADLGLQLGADVPVFVRGHSAWAEGVGERLTPIDPPEGWMLVLVPDAAVSTAEVFRAYDRDVHLTPASTPLRIRDFRAGQGQNDLEPVVRRLYPEVDRALTWLGRFGEARMTGSGACVFLPVAGEVQGREILSGCPAEIATGFVTRSVNRHPVHQRLGL